MPHLPAASLWDVRLEITGSKADSDGKFSNNSEGAARATGACKEATHVGVSDPQQEEMLSLLTGGRQQGRRSDRACLPTSSRPPVPSEKGALLGDTGRHRLPQGDRKFGRHSQTPTGATEGTGVDKQGPLAGTVSIRGRVPPGLVPKMERPRATVTCGDCRHALRKHNRFEKRHLPPCCTDVQVGDTVTVRGCRPLSKTVRFNMLEVTETAGTKKQFQKL